MIVAKLFFCFVGNIWYTLTDSKNHVQKETAWKIDKSVGLTRVMPWAFLNKILLKMYDSDKSDEEGGLGLIKSAIKKS